MDPLLRVCLMQVVLEAALEIAQVALEVLGLVAATDLEMEPDQAAATAAPADLDQVADTGLEELGLEVATAALVEPDQVEATGLVEGLGQGVAIALVEAQAQEVRN